MKSKLVLSFILFLSVLLLGDFIALADDNRLPVSQIVTSDGILIISYTENWDEPLLFDVDHELKNNAYGLDMEYLDRIEIISGLEPGGDGHISASYQKELKQIAIPVEAGGFLPEGYLLPVEIEKGVIRIYQGEVKTTIQDIALDISHEYGHHFSFFYFGNLFTQEGYKESEYYKIRQLQGFDKVNGLYSYEHESHRWSIFEIAAEDYRQLLGSKTAKTVTRFYDISEKLGNSTYQPINTLSYRDYNALPQENWEIPLAHQVEGLREYFYSFIEEQAYEPLLNEFVANESIPALGYTKDVIQGFRRVTISWEPIPTEDIVYTLIAFSEDYKKIMPIKTVLPGQEYTAVIGTVTKQEGRYIYYYQDGLDKETIHLRLHIQYPDGRIYAGQTLTITFQ